MPLQLGALAAGKFYAGASPVSAVYLGSMLVYTAIPFSPLQLFASGEQGVWYDPSDFATMFQDAAGTTPVTAVEQPVGRILDKSGRGNHATQPTATARPVLSARYNLLTKTEQFDDAVWTKNNVTVTANAITAPDGTLTADLIVPFNATAASYVLYTFPGQTTTYANRVSVKNAGKNFIQIMSGFGSSVVAYANVNLTTLATSGAGVTATDAGNGWVDIIFTAPRFEGVSYLLIYVVDSLAAGQSAATVGNGTDGIYVWGASLVPANQSALPYQRVNTATDYDADPAKFPKRLHFDNLDDAHNIAFPSALGSNCTVARSIPGVGAQILTGQTIGTSFSNTITHAGMVIIDRALTVSESNNLTAYLNEKAGV